MAASKVFLKGDPEPLTVSGHPDVVAEQFRAAAQDEFLRVEMAPYTRGEHGRPAYLRPDSITAVLPFHPKEFEYMMDNPPLWLDEDDE